MALQPDASAPGAPTASLVRRLDGLAAAARNRPLSPADEARLLEVARTRVKAGAGTDARTDPRTARESLVDANADLVMDAARAAHKAGSQLLLEDLVAECLVGLLAAVDDYDPLGSDNFREHAARSIAHQAHAAEQSEAAFAREARQLVDDAELYERAEVSIRREKGREATPRELAEKLEWTEERTSRLAEIVAEARRRHDEELLPFLDPEDLV